MKNSNKSSLAIFLVAVIALIMVYSCGQTPQQETATETSTEEMTINKLTEKEKTEGFMLMFDGESVMGWRGYNLPSFPEKGWIIENGTLKVEGSGRGEAGGEGGDIIYEKKFKDFHLKLEWMVSEGGNSGVLYLAQEVENEPIWKSAPEMQVIDNEKFLEMYPDLTALQMAGSLYDLVAAEPQNTKPAGEWNSAEIIVQSGKITHIQNGEVVVETTISTPEWDALVTGSKFAGYDWFGKYEPGYIGLQDHGDDVWYRNIRVKEL